MAIPNLTFPRPGAANAQTDEWELPPAGQVTFYYPLPKKVHEFLKSKLPDRQERQETARRLYIVALLSNGVKEEELIKQSYASIKIIEEAWEALTSEQDKGHAARGHMEGLEAVSLEELLEEFDFSSPEAYGTAAPAQEDTMGGEGEPISTEPEGGSAQPEPKQVAEPEVGQWRERRLSLDDRVELIKAIVKDPDLTEDERRYLSQELRPLVSPHQTEHLVYQAEPAPEPYDPKTLDVIEVIVDKINDNPRLPKAIRDRDPKKRKKTIYEQALELFVSQGMGGVPRSQLIELIKEAANVKADNLDREFGNLVSRLRFKLERHEYTVESRRSGADYEPVYLIVPIRCRDS